MNLKRVGNQTVIFSSPPVILSSYSVVGPKEGAGPLGTTFDQVWSDSLRGEKSWERAESRMLQDALQGAVEQAGVPQDQIDYLLAGDLLNQIISSNFAARQMGLPFVGLYGACSTMALSLAVGSMFIDGGFARNILVGVSSHHDTAERQYRMPTEHGNQRQMSSQWTVTGAGAALLAQGGVGPRVTAATIGRVVDYGESDVNNMGAAMAPAVADVIMNHLRDLNRQPGDYDMIATGDLGKVGSVLAREVLQRSGIQLGPEYADCGVLIFDAAQDVHAGGSGCACSAVVFAGNIMQRLRAREIKRVLLVGSGSLHSPTSAMQKETIPGIGHAVVIEG